MMKEGFVAATGKQEATMRGKGADVVIGNWQETGAAASIRKGIKRGNQHFLCSSFT